MKKLLALGVLAVLLASLPVVASDKKNKVKPATPEVKVEQTEAVEEVKPIEIVPTMSTESNAQNRIWVGTFQIVWNELMDNIIYGPIRFVGDTPKVVKDLNKQSFKKSNISDKSYYTKYGPVSPELKKEIEKGIKEKFNETSDILDSFDWTKDGQRLFVYAMLKKDFKFLQAFDKLAEAPFAKNYNYNVQYFGINDSSNKKLYKNVKVLFYNNSEDFAVKLFTKDKDEVILYRTNEDKTFSKYYSELNEKTSKYHGNKKFVKEDELMVPEISLYQETNFPEVEGRDIRRTNFRIDRSIETVDFKMNNEGVKLKSEAAVMVRMTSLRPDNGRHFYFMDNFVLFLTEKGQNTPYYAMKVSDVETLNKTGRN